jgi:hypothetical protein
MILFVYRCKSLTFEHFDFWTLFINRESYTFCIWKSISFTIDCYSKFPFFLLKVLLQLHFKGRPHLSQPCHIAINEASEWIVAHQLDLVIVDSLHEFTVRFVTTRLNNVGAPSSQSLIWIHNFLGGHFPRFLESPTPKTLIQIRTY